MLETQNKSALHWLSLAVQTLCLIVSLCACNPLPSANWGQLAQAVAQLAPKNLPNLVQSKDGASYIPIDDTAFLVPDKTWLESYGRRSSDGMVAVIILHATVPDVQPWSQARHYEMYSPGGRHLKIFIEKGNEATTATHNSYQISRRHRQNEFIEEPSDQAAQGLRRFRESWGSYSQEDAEDGLKKYGKEHVKRRIANANKPMMDIVYYEYIENDRVKYFIYCGGDSVCHLRFPWGRTLMIGIHLGLSALPHAVAMADKVSNKLREFEAAGLTRKATMAATPSPPLRP